MCMQPTWDMLQNSTSRAQLATRLTSTIQKVLPSSPSNSLLLWWAISPPRSRPLELSLLLACRSWAAGWGALVPAGSAAKRTLSPAGLAAGCRSAAAAAAVVLGSPGGAGAPCTAAHRWAAGTARGAGAAVRPAAALPLVAVSLMAGRAGLLLARSLAGLGGSWARIAAMASLAAATAGGTGGDMPETVERLPADRGRRDWGLKLAPAWTAAAAAGGQPNVAAAGAAPPAATLPPTAMASPPSSCRALASMAAWQSAVTRSTPSFRRT